MGVVSARWGRAVSGLRPRTARVGAPGTPVVPSSQAAVPGSSPAPTETDG